MENSGGHTTIEGNLNSVSNRTFGIRFFSSPSGNEGKKYLGSKNATTNAGGDVSFTFKPENKVGANRNVTATRLLAGDTSEFSAAEAVAPARGRPSPAWGGPARG